MATAPPQYLAACDTNFILSLAENDERCLNALETLQGKVPPVRLIITNTVAEELTYLLQKGNSRQKGSAVKALKSLQSWHIGLQQLNPCQLGITAQIGLKIRNQGLIPVEEVNDGLIMAEAAILDCDFLVTSDGHLRDADIPQLLNLLKGSHVKEAFPVTPAKVIKALGTK